MSSLGPTTGAPRGFPASLRQKLEGKTGRRFWRGLDELSGTREFQSYLAEEFPHLARSSDIDRRGMLKLMGASLALAGLSGCAADERALPYVEAPENLTPGNPKWYASAVSFAGYAQPVLGKTYAGRPVKLEGNPDHPLTGGATDPFLQAALLGLYDPARSQAPLHLGNVAGWSAVDTMLAEQRARFEATGGRGLRLLTGAIGSPTARTVIDDLTSRWPEARWHVHEPFGEERCFEATRRLYGRPLQAHLRLDQAQVVVSFDHDLLGAGPHLTALAPAWARRREAWREGRGESRLHIAEATPSPTGATAGSRLIAGPQRLPALLTALPAALGLTTATPDLTEAERAWIERIAADLRAHAPDVIVTAGPHLDPALQALAMTITERLGGRDRTLTLTEPVLPVPGKNAETLAGLVEDMRRGEVATLVMLDVNPAYSAPAALGFEDALGQVDLRIHAGHHEDETAILSHWHLPLAHELESWGDARACDGTASLIQPLVKPFYAARSLVEVLTSLTAPPRDGMATVSDHWRSLWDDFDTRWRDSLVKGFIAASAAPPASDQMRSPVLAAETAPATDPTFVVRPDPTIWDGRFSENGWLQETPKPMTKITWGNAILLGPGFAEQHALTSGDRVALRREGQVVVGSVWVQPGQDDGTIVLSLGYGRRRGASADETAGYDANQLLAPDGFRALDRITIEPTGERAMPASTQMHQAMDGFDFVRTVSRADLAADQPDDEPPSFYPEQEPADPSWGMSIDLDSCIGCNACVVACMAENNVPVVGREQVAMGREMHWLRVDHYFEGSADDPGSHFQPVPCMHCEDAPCEMGCPVNATVHSSDGLNLQVYNRCIGTRTCSSFCPYKVRRFNWFDFTGDDPEQIRAMRNPEVTVRDRGVMEKCTYCVQRIQAGRIEAELEHRPLRDGDVQTACQQACPTKAISFGNIRDPNADVSRRKASARDYTLLQEVNTRPRTTYLAKVEDDDGGGTE